VFKLGTNAKTIRIIEDNSQYKPEPVVAKGCKPFTEKSTPLLKERGRGEVDANLIN
jgi:hypothetical protein